MRAYIQQIDITTDKKVVVSGLLSRTNLNAKLKEHIYIKEPEDGLWGYTLEVIPTTVYGVDMMIPFSTEAPWTGNESANGLRITQSSPDPEHRDYETTLLKVKKVENFTTEQANTVVLRGASFDELTGQLIIDINYSGGCFPHSFALEWDGSILKSIPPYYRLNLVDLSDYDPCKALVPAQLRFDIETTDIRIQKPSGIIVGTPRGTRQVIIGRNQNG
ncbi:hypothetical protein LVD17_28090 [Fulvivirga ulvae]|uniref:hypothetical protein n=1 Tax=Fulvivirga ulvae TaxID=2904245 RepID=UPI001F1E1F7C|nr:hypothetical protein [Fulvivirga ulvae]UII32149.1 hypothetical protein LVD17_28090 [Fulvivirga ulvae]